MTTAAGALAGALDRVAACDDPSLILAAAPAGWLAELAAEIDARPAAEVPLRGTTFAVKDNIDVAGVATTAGCPAATHVPERSATAVARLVAAGALPTVKVNLDQFATGLVGTRSPFGTPRNPYDAALVPGGSSSGCGVAVATGLASFALGTDTAGSGRVPAAMCGVAAVKPTPGWVSCAGTVPAVRSLDCLAVFAPALGLAHLAVVAAAGFDAADPYSRHRPLAGHAPIRRLGVLAPATLAALAVEPALAEQAARGADLLTAAGFELVEIDPAELFELGDQLYDGPWVSERLAAVGRFGLDPGTLDPAVAAILDGARGYTASDVHRARYRREALHHRIGALWDAVDALAFPTVGWHVTRDDVARDPFGPNTRLGRFTTFTNLAGMCAATVPIAALGDRDDRPPFSLTLHGPAWSDDEVAAAACRAAGDACEPLAPPGWLRLAVAGAHLRGEVLDHELLDRGARFVETTATAPTYRLHAMPTTPPKPALVHAGASGAAIEVDVWALAPPALGDLVASVPPPLAIGTVELAGGRAVPGFVAEPRALDGAVDITAHGGWRAYRRSLRR